MHPSIDPVAIAARVRCLTRLVEGVATPERIVYMARHLRVSEIGLRLSVDEIEPHPSIDVLEAVVREYGVDPTWLVIGEYDPASHRRAMEDGEPGARAEIAKLLVGGLTTASSHATPPSSQIALDDVPHAKGDLIVPADSPAPQPQPAA